MWKVADALGMTARLERRDRRRLKAAFRAVLHGPTGLIEVRGFDASRHGIGAVSPEALAPGSLIFVRLVELGLAGFAWVRRSEARPDNNFILGLEFRDELRRERVETASWSVQHATHTCGVWDAAADA